MIGIVVTDDNFRQFLQTDKQINQVKKKFPLWILVKKGNTPPFAFSSKKVILPPLDFHEKISFSLPPNI
jgi:hypothetical protein